MKAVFFLALVLALVAFATAANYAVDITTTATAATVVAALNDAAACGFTGAVSIVSPTAWAAKNRFYFESNAETAAEVTFSDDCKAAIDVETTVVLTAIASTAACATAAGATATTTPTCTAEAACACQVVKAYYATVPADFEVAAFSSAACLGSLPTLTPAAKVTSRIFATTVTGTYFIQVQDSLIFDATGDGACNKAGVTSVAEVSLENCSATKCVWEAADAAEKSGCACRTRALAYKQTEIAYNKGFAAANATDGEPTAPTFDKCWEGTEALPKSVPKNVIVSFNSVAQKQGDDVVAAKSYWAFEALGDCTYEVYEKEAATGGQKYKEGAVKTNKVSTWNPDNAVVQSEVCQPSGSYAATVKCDTCTAYACEIGAACTKDNKCAFGKCTKAKDATATTCSSSAAAFSAVFAVVVAVVAMMF